MPIVTIGAGPAAGAALSALAVPVQLGMLVLNAAPVEVRATRPSSRAERR